MATYKRRWYHSIYLEFYLNIPLLTIETRLFKEAVERMAYDICRVRIRVYKWRWEFQLYKRPDAYHHYYDVPQPKQPRWGRSKALLRKLHLTKASSS